MTRPEPCYFSEIMTMEQAIRQLPFVVLVPTQSPLPNEGDAEVRIHYMTPVAPGYFPKLYFSYLYPPYAMILVGQGLTDPGIDPPHSRGYRGAEPFEAGGRVFRAVRYRHGIVSLALKEQGTHVTITAGSEMAQESLIAFALIFEPPAPGAGRVDTIIV